MINIPIDQIKEKISKKTGLPEVEINAKINDKLKQLSGLISEEGAAHIVANELGVKLFEVGENLQVKSVLSGMRNVDLAARVIQKYELREFTSAKGPGKVLSMLVGDETGVIRIVLWNKQAENGLEVKDGDIVKVVGGYVRDNQGRKEIHMNDMSKLIINPKGVEVKARPVGSAAQSDFSRKKISEITENDMGVEILATIVQVFDLNFFEVCPQCSKRARLREEGFFCQTHNKVTPDYNFVLNIYLDDGSDNMRVVLWREQAEQLLGMKKDQILLFKEDPAKFESIKHDLLGNMIIVGGRANKNQTFGRIELVAVKVNKNPNPDEETAKLKEEAAKKPTQQTMVQPAASFEKKPEHSFMKTKPDYSSRKPDPDTDGEDFKEFKLDDELVDVEGL